MITMGCEECRAWARLKIARGLPVAGDTYCGRCGAREADVSRIVRTSWRQIEELREEAVAACDAALVATCDAALAITDPGDLAAVARQVRATAKAAGVILRAWRQHEQPPREDEG